MGMWAQPRWVPARRSPRPAPPPQQGKKLAVIGEPASTVDARPADAYLNGEVWRWLKD